MLTRFSFCRLLQLSSAQPAHTWQVLSGAISTLGATFFMFFAPNTFFSKFAAFVWVTIGLSCVYVGAVHLNHDEQIVSSK